MRARDAILVFSSLATACAASGPSASGASPAPELAATAPAWGARLARAAQSLVDAKRAQSVSVAAVKDGHTWTRAFGEAAPGQAASAERSFYEAGSVTKLFTALLLAEAIERGELAPDVTIGDLVPELELPEEVAAIELVALANHSSGLPRMPANFDPADASDPYADYDVKRLWQALGQVELGPPRYAYSNFGMAVLGQLLARRAGDRYESVLRSQILEPLELDGLRLGPGEGDTQGHDEVGAPEPSWRFDAFAPAGALRATAPQMLTFVRAHIDAGRSEGPLGAAMQRAQTRTAPAPGLEGVGLGWHIDPDGCRWHNGQTLGAHSFVGLKPGAHGVVVMANTATGDVDRLGRAMLDILSGQEVELSFTPIIEVPVEQLQRYVGVYVLQPNFSLTITVQEGRLYVQGTGQPAIPLTPIGDHTFEIAALRASGRFILPESGEGPAKALIWNQSGQRIRGPRRE